MVFDPEEFLGHAGRVLDSDTGHAAIRRVVSTCYYALFHLLTTKAGECVAGPGNPALAALLCRMAEHRDMRQLCDALAKAAPKPPAGLSEAFPYPLAPELVTIAQTFVSLQDARHAADYDLARQQRWAYARTAYATTRDAFSLFAQIEQHPNTRAFLVLLLADRKRRRG